MQRIAQQISRLSGWRRCLLAFAAGLASVLALAPFFIWLAWFVTFPVLVWLLDGCVESPEQPRATRRALFQAGLTGWCFGFGYFLAGLYWIGHSFLVDAEIFLWLLPFAVTLLPAGLALFFALAAMAAHPFWRPGLARILSLAIALTMTEWLRGHILTGLPWNTIGYGLTWNEPMMQWASVLGVDGLALLAVMVFAAPAAIWAGAGYGAKGFQRLLYPACMALLIATAWGWGSYRLANASLQFVPGVSLRLVQPSVPQAEKWKPENRAAIFQKLVSVSRKGDESARIVGVTHLIWPESSIPFLLEETPEALKIIAQMMPEGATFITGAARAERGKRASGEASLDVYNSLLVFDHDARPITRYDKLHLVPFGEYLPFQGFLESIGLQQLTRVRGGFTPGSGNRMLEIPGLPPAISLICYEIIFPDAIREPGTRPGWLLNVTNDAWFGDGTGPFQHFHQARLRAVEQGLPLVRVANNGISAVTDAMGRIVARLPRNAVSALDSGLPQSVSETVFARYGRSLLVLLILVACGLWYTVSISTRSIHHGE